jgi:hypothetical protein
LAWRYRPSDGERERVGVVLGIVADCRVVGGADLAREEDRRFDRPPVFGPALVEAPPLYWQNGGPSRDELGGIRANVISRGPCVLRGLPCLGKGLNKPNRPAFLWAQKPREMGVVAGSDFVGARDA